jgi:hypothetical protein
MLRVLMLALLWLFLIVAAAFIGFYAGIEWIHR